MNIKSLNSDEYNLLATIAREYDIHYRQAKEIYDKYPDTFYEELEKFINKPPEQ